MRARRWILALVITLMLIDGWTHKAAADAPCRAPVVDPPAISR